ncbi:hypothetical protein KEM56_004964, partial [Ascosphaera pollenicola]
REKQGQGSADSSKNASASSSSDSTSSAAAVANGDAAATPQEPAVVKELQKQLRNITKKLNGMAKLDATVAENPEKTLDQLVEEKLINLDQKAQALKKPSLQASAAQIEEQIGHFKAYAAYYEAQLAAAKAAGEKQLAAEVEQVRGEIAAKTREESEREFGARLLTLSQFLCAAARMRQAGESGSAESRAFEGVLLQVYSGTEDAVKNMMKLINGVEEKARSVEGDEVDVTCKFNPFFPFVQGLPADLFSDGFVKSASAETAPVPQVYTEVQETTTLTEVEAANGATETITTTTTEEVA